MGKIYLNLLRKSLFCGKRLKKIFLNLIENLKRDFNFHNKNTELLAIWTILFMVVTGLFALALNSDILVMFLLFILAVLISLGIIFFAIYYLYAIKYHKKKQFLPKIHNFLNRSFKLRLLLRFIKIPRILLFVSFKKTFKHLINPAPFFCGVLNPRKKRNHQTHKACCGVLKRCWIKRDFKFAS